jgi:hypothetical protein
MKKLSWEAMQKRRKKGLCFNWDERFTLGHRCEVKHLFIIEVEPEGGQWQIGEKLLNIFGVGFEFRNFKMLESKVNRQTLGGKRKFFFFFLFFSKIGRRWEK